MSTLHVQSALVSWKEEKNAAYLYHFVAHAEKNTDHAQLFLNLAKAAETQALYWEQELKKQNYTPARYIPSFRTKVVSKLIVFLGPQLLKPVLAAMKIRGLSVYLGALPGHTPAHKEAGVLFEETQHNAIQNGNNVRAAVFGVNDGLVSNTSLILGVAGASVQPQFIILSGLAGMLAGAFSMAAGEYISVQSQRELYENQIALERAELETYPEEEAAELSYIYQARGLTKEDADLFAKKMLQNQETALKTLARDELGLNPDDLGSPVGAALSSFLSFTIGSAIPILPFLFTSGKLSFFLSIAGSGLSLFLVGAILSLFTGKNACASGCRMLSIGILAGTTTFLAGKLLGVSVLSTL